MSRNSTTALILLYQTRSRQRIQLHRSKTPLQPQYELIRIDEFRNPFQYAASTFNIMSRNNVGKVTKYYKRIWVANDVTLRRHSGAECEPTYKRHKSNSTTFVNGITKLIKFTTWFNNLKEQKAEAQNLIGFENVDPNLIQARSSCVEWIQMLTSCFDFSSLPRKHNQ